jgi:exopolyphosphatase/guanosine-5'-triphosphate,3'-diphosphate pyrophosphatase
MPKFLYTSSRAHQIAAIDIGSNALRAVIARVKNDEIDILRSLRFPLRLGDSVFRNRQINTAKIRETEEAFITLLHLFAAYGVQDVRALATSAMREAQNSPKLIENLKQLTGIEVRTITGEEEARLIFRAVQHEMSFKHKTAVLMDIGGGSTEISVVVNNELRASHSFNIGTVRLIRFPKPQDQVHLIYDSVREMARFILSYLGTGTPDLFIGTGGNLRRIGKIRRQLLHKPSTECTQTEIAHLSQALQTMTFTERMKKLKLEANRADVIVPATLLTHLLMREMNCKKILLPKVGLKEGILLSMVDDRTRQFLHLR